MRISLSDFRRFISRQRRGGQFIAAMLLLAAAGSAWAITSCRMWIGSNLAGTADVAQTEVSADGLDLTVETAQAPRVELSTHRLDLGDGKPNETLRGELVVTNTGTAALEFTITTSCGCTKPQPTAGTIAPGEEQAIELGIKLPEHANWEKNATVTVHTKDARSKDAPLEVASCAVMARCPAPFAVSPGYVEFGNLSREQAAEFHNELGVESVPGKPAVSVENLQVGYAQEAFKVATFADDDGAIVIRVTLAPKLPFGDHYGTLDLHLTDSDYVMRVPLHARLAEPVLLVPAKAFLRKDPATGRRRPATVLVMSRPAAGAVGRVRLVDGPPGLRVEDVGAVGAMQRRLRLSADGEIAASESVVRLAADGVENELSLKLVVTP
ncbi:MAG TPA: DUF1573 domain-containing protein [Pirellulales bacterium]|nr:DUF1573 domain-containing protein [Pirellulales bacterium]